MIVLLIGVILSVSFGLLAWAARLHPIQTFRRSIQVGGCIAAVLTLVIALLLYPSANVWQHYQAGKATASQYDVEYVRAKNMIKVLGSPEAYIEYLKATQEK